MEKNNVINQSKLGKIPLELERDLPEIAQIIKKMISLNPAERPTIEVISQFLKLPLEINADLVGGLRIQKENSSTWREKYTYKLN